MWHRFLPQTWTVAARTSPECGSVWHASQRLEVFVVVIVLIVVVDLLPIVVVRILVFVVVVIIVFVILGIEGDDGTDEGVGELRGAEFVFE